MITTFSEDSLCAVKYFIQSLRLNSFPSAANSDIHSSVRKSKAIEHTDQSKHKVDPVAVVMDAIIAWYKKQQRANDTSAS
jgi:hypothetical protein